MKKIGLLLLAFCLSGIIPAIARDRKIPVSELPENATRFITDNFGSIRIVYVEKERNKYEVKLSNGMEVDFFDDGTWKNVEGKGSIVPEAIVKTLPADINSYINTNFESPRIIGLKKKVYGYEVELIDPSTGEDIELQFDQSGKFLKMDD